MSTNHRIIGLDALRGLAALAVVLTHFTSTYYLIYRIPATFPVNIGEAAVALFFIISGFVILMTLDRASSVREFVVSRFSRLYPVFWVSVALTFSIVHFFALPGRATSIRDAAVNLTMVPSFFGAAPVDVVYWSLTVEISFYVIVGAIFALGLRRYLVPLISGLILVGIADHYWAFAQHIRFGFRIERLFILGWWPLFLLGMTIFQIRSGFQRRHAAALVLCAIAEILAKGWSGWVNCALALVVFAATTNRLPLLNKRVVLTLGAISYSLYLTHSNIGYCIIRAMLALGAGQLVAALVALTVTVAIASLLWYFIERPSHRYVRAMLTRKRHTASSMSVRLPEFDLAERLQSGQPSRGEGRPEESWQ